MMYTLHGQHGRTLSLERAVLMGILNVTPDSFFDGGQYESVQDALSRARQMTEAGAAIIDVGGASSRPGAEEVPLEEELRRVVPVIEAIRSQHPNQWISVDTWRAEVARQAVTAGADMVNDISGGQLDPEMFKAIGQLKVPYILMHLQGTPQTMQANPQYADIAGEVLSYFQEKIMQLRAAGAHQIVLDPGFGFGKTLDQNYELFAKMERIVEEFDLPLLVGVSRKSMIYKLLGITPDAALNGSTALHALALERGASILRVHDINEADEVIRLWQKVKNADPI